MRKILFLSTLVPRKYENKIRYISIAANRFITNLCDALESENQINFLSFLGIPVEDAVKKDLKESADGKIRYFFKSDGFWHSLKQYKKCAGKEILGSDILMTYNITYAWLFAPGLAKRCNKKSVLILADFSDPHSESGWKRKLYAYIQQHVIRQFDYVIGLSVYTKRFLRPNQIFICIEGGIDQAVFDYFDFNESDIKERISAQEEIIFMYAGILEPVTGIDQLLSAFQVVSNPNIRLWVSGRGTLENLVKTAEKTDNRIRYLGCLEYGEYLDSLANADVLINPRNMDMPENINNFPSKIMEYLATGKKIISTRFPGWERFAKCITFVDSDITSIKEGIEKTTPNTNEKYLIQREFAAQFMWQCQAKKINEMIRE